MSSIIPVLDDQHPLLVDASGRLVDGPPRPGTFAARRPQPFTFGGTVPHEALFMGRTHPDIDYKSARKILARVNSDNLEFLQQAVFDLSQTDIGVERLRAMQDVNSTVIFDRDRLLRRKAGAAAEHPSYFVILGWDDHPGLCHSLAHESDHIFHMSGGLRSSLGHSVQAVLKTSFAMEASARAVQGLFAHQCEMADWQRQDIYRPAGMIKKFQERYPEMGRAAKENIDLAWQQDWPRFAQKLLEAYIYETSVTSSYQKRLMEDIVETVTKAKSLKNALTQDVSGADIVGSLTIGGEVYADPDFLDRPEIVTLSGWRPVQRAYKQLRAVLDPLNEVNGNKMKLEPLMEEECRIDLPPLKVQVRELTGVLPPLWKKGDIEVVKPLF